MATTASAFRSQETRAPRRPDRAIATSESNGYKPSYVPAAIAAGLVFILYLVTLAPSVAMWDTGEYMAAVKVLGIPHPPGNPFFMLLGHAFASLPIPVSYAAKINIMAALASACSAGLWFLITERIVARWITEKWQRLVVASLATLIGATAFTVWNQSVVNEKVYTISLLFFTIVSWIIIEWIEEPDAPRADRLVVLVCFLLGLGYANHPAGFLPLPAAGVALIATRWRTVLRWKLVLACVGALILGLTPFIYEPVRAAYFPAINEGAPTACATKLEASCTFTKLTQDRLLANINREQYGQKLERGAPYSAQVGMWWFYFKWQWIRDSHQTMQGLQFIVAFLFLGLGLLGGYVHWDRDRKTFWYFGPLMFTMTLALIYYLNFKYGWSQDPDVRDVAREVRDRDYFYIWSFSAWGVWAAIGLSFIWEQLALVLGGEARNEEKPTVRKPVTVGAWPSRRGFMLAAPILLIALIPFFANWRFASRAGHYFTAQWAKDYLNSLEPYAVVITNGDHVSGHRLVRAADDPAADRDVRRRKGASDLSKQAVEETVWSAAQDDFSGSRCDSRIHTDHSAADFPSGQHHAEHSAGYSRPRSAGATAPDQGCLPRAADLRLDRWWCRTRTRAVPVVTRFRPEAVGSSHR